MQPNIVSTSLISMLAAIILLAAPAAAAVPAATAGPIPMQGEAQVDQGGRTPVLLLSADATDGSGYHLEANLTPLMSSGAQQGRSGEREGSGQRGQGSGAVGLDGAFTLSGPGLPTVSGNATGQLSQSGTGTLSLTDGQGILNLTANFSVDGSGAVDLDLAGTLPSAVPSQPSVAAPLPSVATASATTDQPVDHTFWYISRAAGMAAYLLLCLNVCLGIGVHTRIVDALTARWRSFDLHQFTAVLAMGFLGLHAVSLLGDRYIGFTPDQLLIPLASPYRPVWTALGVIGAYLMVVVFASSYLRKYVGYRTWRALHYLTFGAYLMALGHGIFAGTDTGEPWARAMYWSTGALVAMLMIWRFRRAGERRAARVGSRSPAGGTP